ncbi:MAG: phosphotransferase [Pseudonocardiaceae bacterium]
MTQPTRWIKRYPNPASCQTAVAHHQWLAGLGTRVPALRAVGAQHLEFDHVTGRHAQPRDLLQIAGLLGRLHSAAYTTDLHHARLDRPHTTSTGVTIPDFITPRRKAITTLLTSATVPATPFTSDQAIRELETAADSPACLYKDSNPRNFLITITATTSECVLVDFDVLTLAPAGYDLAKLIVTLTMTHGPLPHTQLRATLAAYNTALTDDPTRLRPVSWTALMTWANIHHILTSPYLGRGGYRHTWTGQPS